MWTPLEQRFWRKHPQDKIAANGQLDGAIFHALAIVENYPQLKSNELFLKLRMNWRDRKSHRFERKRTTTPFRITIPTSRYFPTRLSPVWRALAQR